MAASSSLSNEQLHESAATKLRKTLDTTDKLLVCPGVYDGFSARIALSVGFDALYMTGAGTTASRLGHADLGIAQLHDMREHAEMIANLDPRVPLIADADAGYGGPIMVARTVEHYIRSGVAALHLEDQVTTKRCGHLANKELVSPSVFVSRIRAAVSARRKLNSDIVIIARTDSLASDGYDEAINRLKLARDAGADAGFLEGMTTKEQAKQAVQDLAPWPLLLNMVEFGKTPTISVDEAKTMGYRIIIFPLGLIAPAYVAIRDTLKKLKETGLQGTPEGISPKFIFDVCGMQESAAVDAEAGGNAFGEPQ